MVILHNYLCRCSCVYARVCACVCVSFPQVIILHYSSIIHYSFITPPVPLATVKPVGLHCRRHCGPPANRRQENNEMNHVWCVHVNTHKCYCVPHACANNISYVILWLPRWILTASISRGQCVLSDWGGWFVTGGQGGTETDNYPLVDNVKQKHMNLLFSSILLEYHQGGK